VKLKLKKGNKEIGLEYKLTTKLKTLYNLITIYIVNIQQMLIQLSLVVLHNYQLPHKALHQTFVCLQIGYNTIQSI